MCSTEDDIDEEIHIILSVTLISQEPSVGCKT